MTSSSIYILDSNVFMEAARRYYAFDLVEQFWHALVEHAAGGQIISIDRVKAEINKGKDQLMEWSNNDFHEWFVSTNEDDVLSVYGGIMIWGHNHPQFTDPAKAEFARAENADPWVVAYAKARGVVVVTLEKLDPNIRRKVQIPNVCEAFGVQYVDTFQMLRNLGVKLGS